ncbi:MAG TPA: type IV pilin [Methanocorpusculum sp.]|nr:type IV pilin [Methanocorpusculum sp.]HJK80935.1 type IV pilin [Methanocorpusculum sp.]
MKSVAKKDDAVSPVIGTILLVAITVVLVAIVAAVVMGMVGNMSDQKDVGVIVQPGVDSVLVTVSSGADANKLTDLAVYADNTQLTKDASLTGNVVVGKPYNFTESSLAGNYKVTVTGNFTDNTSSVIYTGTVAIV